MGRGVALLLCGIGLAACDRDQDGYSGSDDCDDGAAEINPGAREVCDEVDNDCDGVVDFDECAEVFGRTFEITILEAETPYSWDDGAFVSPASRAVDMKVEFGTDLTTCFTEEVEDSSTASWNEKCTFTLESSGLFFIDLYDVDFLGSEEISYWSWANPGDLFDFGIQPDGTYWLTENENKLKYRIKRVD